MLSRCKILEQAVGECKTVEVKLRGIKVPCPLDTGIQIIAISDKFFKEHLAKQGKDLHLAFEWSKFTAANGLEVPHMGYVEQDVEVIGLTISERGLLMVQKSAHTASVPCHFVDQYCYY